MNKIFITVLVAATLLFSTTSITDLSCTTDNNLVKIEWKTSAETNIKEFVIEKSSNNINFEIFNTEAPKGSNSSYVIIDSTPYSKSTTLYYRIKIVDYDGTEKLSDVISVEINSAGISATWGSIKAMFR